MNQACIDCLRSLVCISGRSDDTEGTVSACHRHGIAFVWTSATAALEAGDDDRISRLLSYGAQWVKMDYFAEMFGVKCNCEAARLCSRVVRLTGAYPQT